jgi:hypothetical protein
VAAAVSVVVETAGVAGAEEVRFILRNVRLKKRASQSPIQINSLLVNAGEGFASAQTILRANAQICRYKGELIGRVATA